MQRQAVLLVALVGALLLAGIAAGPIRPVQDAKESEYVFVKLIFDGHDQPNFDRWHSNATAATVAQAAGVPVHYLIRLVDGKIPGTEKAAPAGPKKQGTELKKQPEPASDPTPTPAPTTTTTTTPATTPAAATPAPATTNPTPSVTLITNGQPKPQETEQKAVATKPESGEGAITTPAPAPVQPRQQESLWSRLTGARRIDPTSTPPSLSELEPNQVPINDVPQRPRVFVIGGRKLMGTTQVSPNQALVEYAIKTNASEPWAVRDTVKRKLMASAAGFGMAQGTSLKGFYSLLKEHGVGYYPSMWVDGEQILAGEVAMQAPPNRFINGTKGAKNFQHKLYKHTDLVKPKVPAGNTTNVTIAEPAFIMANRSTTTQTTTTSSAAPHRSGLAPWMSALIALGTVAVSVALAATVWRCVRDRRRRQAEEDAAHSEPLSPHSVVSTSHPAAM